ncbi:hypothetical protein Prum_094150 [Phytohabitans rumicis]|uniref:Phospholipid/glycerol acyltransferase domain-containing protein n=1 Tax=Phytohabitans rumicis TaxID=1076125 RepID=A0A6V8LEY1_9ACTN|nr:hypothetical protein Prum_094150 [Phytohabitans rumicis]
MWRVLLFVARVALAPFARLRVTGDVPAGPVILAANHIGPVDPVVLMAACRTRGWRRCSWRTLRCSGCAGSAGS